MSKAIDRREFLKRSALAGGLAALPPSAQALLADDRSESGSPPPNLLIVFPDQMRAHAQGFMNEDPAITPTLDAFSKESMVFTQAVSNYPVCSPFRAMFMTGKFPHSNGVLSNCNSHSAPHGYELAADARCWSDVLKARGYEMGYIGKWHLDAPHEPYVDCANNRDALKWNEWCPPSRRHGFGFWHAYGTYDYHMRPMYWSTDATRNEPVYVDQWGPQYEADMAIRFLRGAVGRTPGANRPFALVVSMNPPHPGYSHHPPELLEHYAAMTDEQLCARPNIPPAGKGWGKYYRKHIRDYLAMVTGVDEQFGRILRALDETGLAENTIVVFMSDHGNCLGIHNEISKNNHYEESMRIPLMIRWPRRIRPRHDDLLISVPDLYPTLLDLMGCAAEIPSDVQGTSHAQLMLTGEGPRPSSQLYMHVPVGDPAGDRRGVRTHRYTLMTTRVGRSRKRHVLHDNLADPYQLCNIAKQNEDIVQKLKTEELEPWLRKTHDPWLQA